MKKKILAGLILTGVICFSGTAFATSILTAPKNPNVTPPKPPEWNGQPPANINGNDNVKPPVPPNNSVKPPAPPNSNIKPPVQPGNNVKPPAKPDSNMKPPMPPQGNGSNNHVKSPKPGSLEGKAPADFKPGDIKTPPQLKK